MDIKIQYTLFDVPFCRNKDGYTLAHYDVTLEHKDGNIAENVFLFIYMYIMCVVCIFISVYVCKQHILL